MWNSADDQQHADNKNSNKITIVIINDNTIIIVAHYSLWHFLQMVRVQAIIVILRWKVMSIYIYTYKWQ